MMVCSAEHGSSSREQEQNASRLRWSKPVFYSIVNRGSRFISGGLRGEIFDCGRNVAGQYEELDGQAIVLRASVRIPNRLHDRHGCAHWV